MTYLQQRCLLCGEVEVRYAKTKGGFHKICDRCRAILEANDLLQLDQIKELQQNVKALVQERDTWRQRAIQWDRMSTEQGDRADALDDRVAKLEAREKRLLEALTAARETCLDVTAIGAFAKSVDPIRWIAQLQEHLSAILREIESEKGKPS